MGWILIVRCTSALVIRNIAEVCITIAQVDLVHTLQQMKLARILGLDIHYR